MNAICVIIIVFRASDKEILKTLLEVHKSGENWPSFVNRGNIPNFESVIIVGSTIFSGTC